MMAQADTSNADYQGIIRVTNNSTAATNVAANVSISSPAWINAGILNSSANDSTIQSSSGSDTPFMPGYGTNPWIFYVDSISSNNSINNPIYSSGVTGVTPLYFPGAGGMGVSSSTEMKLGNLAFNWEIQGFFDTSATSINSNIIHSTSNSYARLYVQAAGNLRASITVYGATTYYCDASMTSGYHKLNWTRPTAGSGNMTLYIDDVYSGSVAVGAVGVVDDNSPWVFCESPAVLYMDYFSENVTGVNVAFYQWEYGATFTDQSGEGNTATPTFRTSSTDANVSASLISFSPVTQAKSTATLSGDWPELIEDAPEEPETAYDEEERPGIFFEPIVYTLANASGVPESFFFYIFCYIVIIIPAGMLSYRIHPSLTLKWAVMLSLIVLFAAPGLNMFGMFTAIYFAMAGAGLILISRSYGI